MTTKFLKFGLISLATVAILIGCGGGDSAPTTTPTPPPTTAPPESNIPEGCKNAKIVQLTVDTEGTVNYTGANEESSSCYKINLSSNNSVETYMMYMNLYNGTSSNITFRNKVKLYNEDGAEEHQFDTNWMFRSGNRFKEDFEISSDGDYYIKVYREGNEATKFGFSIHPSLENGLVQNNERELNDHFVMAAPITLDEAMKDINGSLNMSRTQDNSLKNTDNEDYYIMDFSKTGTYAFYINLYNGTHSDVSHYAYIEIFDENGASEHKFDSQLYKSGQYYSNTFNINIAGKYYIRISRDNNEAIKYGFSIHPSVANGLVQNSDRELNDFMSMAAPINWSEITNSISGSLNVTRKVADSSIQNTDRIDYYAIDFTQTGSHTLDFNLTSGTLSNVIYEVDLKLRNSVGTIVEEFPSLMYRSGQNLNSTFNIPSVGLYYLSIDRYREATNYSYTITKP